MENGRQHRLPLPHGDRAGPGHPTGPGLPPVRSLYNCAQELSPAYLRELKNRAEAYGASFVSVHPYTSAIESNLLFGDYPRRTAEAFDFYRRYMAACAFLGGKYVVIHGQSAGHGALSDQGTGSGLGSSTAWGTGRAPGPPRRTSAATGPQTRPFSGGCAAPWGRSAPLCWM